MLSKVENGVFACYNIKGKLFKAGIDRWLFTAAV
jgi:hypothetical protein